ncbi:MAG: 2-oxo acid dehydrogenase subunit E2 [Firmicutes bacterium]|nr:2-oxo acid dehydrogenase subunit E2 [Bacillota bacterium]MBQ6260961.1 2-oxo acid dehydrogenase subunit E2 [Bacillota bacterium]MBR0441966.1 2-oxo acid dehydrogenase subunit E2 [Bacillota bacterium]
MFGKRPDGVRVKGIDPVIKITSYVMPMRCDAQVFLKHRANLERLNAYVKRQKAEKNETLSYMQIIVAAYVRAISANPEVNRFIMNKQLFARNNCSAAFTILKDPEDIDKGEAVVKIKFDLTDTVYDVRDRMVAAIEANRDEQAPGFVDKLLRTLFAVPGLATVVVGLVKILDKYGIAPSILMEELPFYVGMYITNTASIGLHDVNHHLYNWGNVGLFLGMGVPERIAVVEGGNMRMRRYLPIGITADERVCSGAHYARLFADVKKYLDHPELLEVPPEKVVFDQGVEYHEPKVKKTEG